MASADQQRVPAGDGAELVVLRDRDRLADELRNEVIQRIFAVGLSLDGAADRAADPVLRDRIAKAVDDLDYVIRVIRDAVFALRARSGDHGLRARIMRLSEQFPVAADVSFRGPVDGALDPGTAAQSAAPCGVGPGTPCTAAQEAGLVWYRARAGHVYRASMSVAYLAST